MLTQMCKLNKKEEFLSKYIEIVPIIVWLSIQKRKMKKEYPNNFYMVRYDITLVELFFDTEITIILLLLLLLLLLTKRSGVFTMCHLIKYYSM
jgi:hypothetical protein